MEKKTMTKMAMKWTKMRTKLPSISVKKKWTCSTRTNKTKAIAKLKELCNRKKACQKRTMKKARTRWKMMKLLRWLNNRPC